MYYTTIRNTRAIFADRFNSDKEYTAKQIKAILSDYDDTMSMKALRNRGILVKVREEQFDKKLSVPATICVLVDNNGNVVNIEVSTYRYTLNRAERETIDKVFNNGNPLHVEWRDTDTIKVSRYYYKYNADAMEKFIEREKDYLRREAPYNIKKAKHQFENLKKRIASYEAIMKEIERD